MDLSLHCPCLHVDKEKAAIQCGWYEERLNLIHSVVHRTSTVLGVKKE